jgi:transposase, IS30 family
MVWSRLSEVERVEIQRRLGLGESSVVIAAAVGRSHDCVDRVRRACGGVPPRRQHVCERYLSLAEREEISRGLVGGSSFAAIARGLGRSTSTVSREVNRNGGRGRYRAWDAQRHAQEQARRPKIPKLAQCPRLRRAVTGMLTRRFSPQQIARRLRLEYPHEPEMRVSHETIYQSLFVQGRGTLRKELHRHLRSGRALRRARHRAETGGGISNMVMISERPAEVEDRAVPGHWEGDLIVGSHNRSAIGTLVERQTRYVLLCRLPNGHGAEAVRDAIAKRILTLPGHLRRSLTWDQGREMAQHAEFTIATGVQVYFCDPHSPWQRGSNENTNGLLRQYFPKSTDLSGHSQQRLNAVARELNGRPRQTLGWLTPSEKLAELIATTA